MNKDLHSEKAEFNANLIWVVGDIKDNIYLYLDCGLGADKHSWDYHLLKFEIDAFKMKDLGLRPHHLIPEARIILYKKSGRSWE